MMQRERGKYYWVKTKGWLVWEPAWLSHPITLGQYGIYSTKKDGSQKMT